MSSSGKGQSIIQSAEEIDPAWQHSLTAGRTQSQQVIIEEFLTFDYEITLLTVKHESGVSFCDPIGHQQHDGDYQLSWQPHPCQPTILEQAQAIAKRVVNALGGTGIFGVELFVANDHVYFNEASPRPHDTGLVTLISQNLSQFDLHIRAVLGLPIPHLETIKPSASRAITLHGYSRDPKITGIQTALKFADTDIRLFSKPSINGKRRLGVLLATDTSIENARLKASEAYECLELVE